MRPSPEVVPCPPCGATDHAGFALPTDRRAQGHVDAVTVAVLEGPARTVVSRYVVRVRALTEAATAGRKERADAMARLDAQLQAHLLALYAAPAPPPRAEDERTFEIVVRASEAGVTPGGAWMAAAPSESGETAARVAARPLKDPDPAAALVSVQTYLEIPKLEPEGSASG